MGSSKSQPKNQNKQAQTQKPTLVQQKKTQIVTKTKQQPKSGQQIISDKQISSIVDSVTTSKQQKNGILIQNFINDFQNQIKNNQTLNQLKQQHRQLTINYFNPIKNCYTQIPQAITAFKFSYINCYNYNDRLTALGLASMVVGLASFRTAKSYQFPLKSFGALKDAAVAYFIGGLVIAPQIYNPLMQD